jgi:4-amino-4-deoxy-L-arabinose transferase-like glycosyltransferase
VAIVAVAFGLRAVWPLADPARRLSWSGGIWTDPATVVHAARNAVLYGDWVRDDSRDLVFYPLLNWLTWLAYQMVGPGRLATQLLAAILGAGTVAAVAWAVSRAVGRRGATIAAALVATGWWLVMFGRVPLVENVVALLLAVAAAFALGRGRSAGVVAGFVAGVAMLFGKLHAVSFLPALFLFVLARERRVGALAGPALGVAAAATAWGVVIVRPFGAEILEQLRATPELYGAASILRSPLEGIAEPLRAIQRSWLFVRMPVLGALGVAFTLGTLASAELQRERTERGTALFALWFAFAWIYHALLPYQAPRYYLPAAVALVVAAACQLEELARGAGLPRRRPRGVAEIAAWSVGLLAAGVAIVVTVAHAAWGLRDVVTPSSSGPALREVLGGVAAALNPFPTILGLGAVLALALATVAVRIWTVGGPAPSGGARLAARLLALVFVIQGAQLAWWATHRTYALEDAKRSLDVVVAEDAVLFGGMAPALVQDGERVGIPRFGAPVTSLPREVTHVATLGDPAWAAELSDELRADVTLVRRWPLRSHGQSFVGVGRLPNDAYRSTDFERAVDALADDRPADAIELLAAGPETWDAVQLEARAWFRLGDEQRARDGLRRAIELRPTSPADHHNLGRLLERAGEPVAAEALWRRGLALDPDDRDLLRALGLEAPER